MSGRGGVGFSSAKGKSREAGPGWEGPATLLWRLEPGWRWGGMSSQGPCQTPEGQEATIHISLPKPYRVAASFLPSYPAWPGQTASPGCRGGKGQSGQTYSVPKGQETSRSHHWPGDRPPTSLFSIYSTFIRSHESKHLPLCWECDVRQITQPGCAPPFPHLLSTSSPHSVFLGTD